MSITLGCVCNFFNEINAIPGFLETHSGFFDHMSFYQSGPGGQESNDGSIELLEKWQMPIHRGKIDDGFGIVRTAAIRSSPCDFVMILDADERFYPILPVLSCVGESTPPDEVSQVLYEYDRGALDRNMKACPSNWENLKSLGAKLSVKRPSIDQKGITYWLLDQGKRLRDSLDTGEFDAVRTIRRHWHDFTWTKPTQNWHTDPDFQTRIVRNKESIYYASSTRMHEQLVGAQNVFAPDMTRGPFFDHYHLFFKAREPQQRRHDVTIYDQINNGRKPPTTQEYEAMRKEYVTECALLDCKKERCRSWEDFCAQKCQLIEKEFSH